MEPGVNPTKVTKPMQLLAAWLFGLITVNGLFLGAAAKIERPEWAAGILVVASILNVPIFLACLFLLQTKFRPEMQEDSYYQNYLKMRLSPETRREELVEIKSFHSHQAKPGTPLSFDTQISQRQKKEDLATIFDLTPNHVVSLNDLLPSYKEISAQLIKAGINVGNTFGSTSTPPEVPKPFVLAVGHGADLPTFRKIFSICCEFGLEGVGLAADPFSNGHLYIGAYSYDKENSYAAINKELKERLSSPNLNWRDMLNLLPDRNEAINYSY